MKSWQAILFIIVVSAVLTMMDVPSGDWFTMATLSLVCGTSALALMGVAASLSSRSQVVERIFGGLDRVYAVHKWLAVFALALASVHLMFKAGIRSWEVAPIVALPSEWTRFVRQASFVALMVIVLLALNRNIPYSQWRWWHRLSGPLFLLVIAHWLSIKSPVEISSPAGLWLALWAALGVLCAAYKLVLYPFVAKQGHYRVVSAERGNAAVRIELAPVSRKVDFKAGSFGFLRMRVDGLREPHPFTIASAPAATGHIAFVVRALGDYTSELVARVEPEMHADVYGPYGRFQRKPESDREIWIGGGVGISPFLAWLKDQDAERFGQATLFYFFTPGRVFPMVDELQALAQERGIEFIPIDSGPNSPGFRQRFAEIAKSADGTALDIAVCGPAGLLDKVRDIARENGIDARRIRSEMFSFR